MDNDTREYLEDKFGSIYRRMDDQGNRLTAIETVLQRKFVPMEVCNVKHKEVEELEGRVKTLSQRLWAIIVLIVTAMFGVAWELFKKK